MKITMLGSLILCAGIIAAMLSSCDQQKTAGSAAEPQTVSAISVSSTQLFSDYHANEVSADAKYKGKHLAVTGRVIKIRKDALDAVVIDLYTPNQFMLTRAQLRENEKESAANLKRGQEIMLLCIGEGLLIGSPMVGECRIVDRAREDVSHNTTGKMVK